MRLVAQRRGVSESLLLIGGRLERRPPSRQARPRMSNSFRSACSGAMRRANRRCWRLPESIPAPEPPPAEGKGESIEITLPNGTRVSVDALVNDKALSRVLRAIKGMG